MKKKTSIILATLLTASCILYANNSSNGEKVEQLQKQEENRPLKLRAKNPRAEAYDKQNLLKNKTYYLYNGVKTNERVFIDYLDNEKLAGQSFCNMFFASITKDKKLENIGATRMACPPEIERDEQNLLNHLFDSKVIFDGKRIVFKKADKRIVFVPEKK